MRGGRDLLGIGICSSCRVSFALVDEGVVPIDICIKVCIRYAGCYPLCRTLTHSTSQLRVGVSLSGKVAPSFMGLPFLYVTVYPLCTVYCVSISDI